MSHRFEFQSCIRGYHVYPSIWSSSSGEVLACHREPHNRENLFAVGVYEDATLVGRVPRKFSCVYLLFLRRGGTITSKVTGSRLYSSDLLQGGLGLPCVYVLEGEGKLIEKAKEISRFYFRELPIFAKFAKIKSRENFSH